MAPSAFLWIVLVFAAICLWQLLAGLSKMRRAKANPQDPAASLMHRFGKIQTIASGAMLLLNIVFNLPALRLLMAA